MDNNLDSIKDMLSKADESLGERASSIDQKKQNIEMAAIDAILEIESLLESLSPDIKLKEEKASSVEEEPYLEDEKAFEPDDEFESELESGSEPVYTSQPDGEDESEPDYIVKSESEEDRLKRLQETLLGSQGADKLAAIKEKDRIEQERVAQEKVGEKSYRSDATVDGAETNPEDPLDVTINIDGFAEKPVMTTNTKKQENLEKPIDPLDVRIDIGEALGRQADRPAEEPIKKPAERPVEKLTAKPIEKLEENPTEKPTAKPAEKPIEKPAEKPSKTSAINDFDAYAARLLKAAETGDESYLKEEKKQGKIGQQDSDPDIDEATETADISAVNQAAATTDSATASSTDSTEEKPKKKRTIQIDDEKPNPLKGILMGLITILFIVAAAVAIILTFFQDTSVGHAINKLIGREVAQPANQGGNQGEEGSNQGFANSGENSENSENQGTASSSQNKAPSSNTIIGKAILSKIDLAEEIARVEESGELRFVIEKDYGVEGITKAISFDDDIWYMSEHTENIHYTPELVGFAIDYYSKLYKRINKDDDAVLKLIVPDSKLMGDVSAVKKDAIVLHHLNKLEIGEIRRNGNDFYMMVRLSESTNDGKADSQVTKVLRMTTDNKEVKMAEIVDAK